MAYEPLISPCLLSTLLLAPMPVPHLLNPLFWFRFGHPMVNVVMFRKDFAMKYFVIMMLNTKYIMKNCKFQQLLQLNYFRGHKSQ